MPPARRAPYASGASSYSAVRASADRHKARMRAWIALFPADCRRDVDTSATSSVTFFWKAVERPE
jgi:hypothetical protein